MQKRIKGIIFDLDGIITDTAKFHYKAWKQIIAPYGMKLTSEINEKIKGLDRKNTLLKILEVFNYQKLSVQQIDQLCFEKNELYKTLIASITPNDILPGIKPFLEESKNQKILLAIASSSKNAPIILKRLQIFDVFNYLVDPSTVKKGKPAPDIYLAAANGLKLNADECIGLEDASAGIIGLNAAHIFSVGINPTDNYVKKNSRYFLESTKDLDLNKVIKAYQTSL